MMMDHSKFMIELGTKNKFMEFLYKAKLSNSKGIIRNFFSYLKIMHDLDTAIIDFNTLVEIHDFIDYILLLFMYSNNKNTDPIVLNTEYTFKTLSFSVIDSVGEIQYDLYTGINMVEIYFRRNNGIITHIKLEKNDDSICDDKYTEYLLLLITNITMNAVKDIINKYYWNL